MRIERRAIALVAALLLAGATGAGGCATLLCPFYVAAVRTLSSSQGWQVVSAEVRTSQHGPGRVVALTTDFYRSPHDARSTARVVSELQVGAIAEGPIVLFSILALWPLQAGRRRWRLLLAGVAALDNGLARRPPMGWNSWNAYGGESEWCRVARVGPRALGVGRRALGIGGATHRRPPSARHSPTL